jgi:hypothetical protein
MFSCLCELHPCAAWKRDGEQAGNRFAVFKSYKKPRSEAAILAASTIAPHHSSRRAAGCKAGRAHLFS